MDDYIWLILILALLWFVYAFDGLDDPSYELAMVSAYHEWGAASHEALIVRASHAAREICDYGERDDEDDRFTQESRHLLLAGLYSRKELAQRLTEVEERLTSARIQLTILEPTRHTYRRVVEISNAFPSPDRLGEVASPNDELVTRFVGQRESRRCLAQVDEFVEARTSELDNFLTATTYEYRHHLASE